MLLFTACEHKEQDTDKPQSHPKLVYSKVPYHIPDSLFKPLRSCIDDNLQSALVSKVSNHAEWSKLAAQKRLALGLVDLSDPYKIKFARINGNEMMYAASLPKIAILLAAMDAMENGELAETDSINRDMRLMISKSDNGASTRMIDRLGYEKIEQVLTDPKYELYDEEYGGGLWVGKRYAAQGERHPDPLKGLSHAATVSQVCRFYYLMVYGRLVNDARSKQMLDIMADPALHHKFVNTIEKIAPKAKLYRKSGTWKTYHSDSMLVLGPKWRRYILVALVDDPSGEMIMRQLVLTVEDVLKSQQN